MCDFKEFKARWNYEKEKFEVDGGEFDILNRRDFFGRVVDKAKNDPGVTHNLVIIAQYELQKKDRMPPEYRYKSTLPLRLFEKINRMPIEERHGYTIMLRDDDFNDVEIGDFVLAELVPVDGFIFFAYKFSKSGYQPPKFQL